MALEQTVQMVSVVIVATSVVIGVINSIYSSRREERTREAQLFMNIHDRFKDVEFWRLFLKNRSHEWRDYDDWRENYGRVANLEVSSSWAAIGAYFEGVGVMVNRKLIDIDEVYDLMHSPIFIYWEKYEAVTKEMRDRMKNPEVWVWVEYLYNELKKFEQQQV